MSERIIGVAIRHGKLTFSMEAPARHGTLMSHMWEAGLQNGETHGDQGFVTNQRPFVTREEAVLVAQAAGQIKVKTGPDDELFSEDVW